MNNLLKHIYDIYRYDCHACVSKIVCIQCIILVYDLFAEWSMLHNILQLE